MSRASAPAITSPDSVTETTLGTMPERMRGPVSSITATKLFVVPKSMPTIGDFSFPKSIWKDIFHFSDKVSDVSPAIEQPPNFFEVSAISRRRERHVNRIAHRDKTSSSFDQLWPRGAICLAISFGRRVAANNM